MVFFSIKTDKKCVFTGKINFHQMCDMFLDAAQLNQRILDVCDPFLTQLPSGVKLQGFPTNIKIILPERKIFL